MYASAIVADGVVFVASQRHLWAVAAESALGPAKRSPSCLLHEPRRASRCLNPPSALKLRRQPYLPTRTVLSDILSDRNLLAGGETSPR